MPRHLLKPCSGEMKHVFAGQALEAVLASARRPPGNEDSRTDRSPSLGGSRRSFVTVVLSALAVAIAAFALYRATLLPGFDFGDRLDRDRRSSLFLNRQGGRLPRDPIPVALRSGYSRCERTGCRTGCARRRPPIRRIRRRARRARSSVAAFPNAPAPRQIGGRRDLAARPETSSPEAQHTGQLVVHYVFTKPGTWALFWALTYLTQQP